MQIGSKFVGKNEMSLSPRVRHGKGGRIKKKKKGLGLRERGEGAFGRGEGNGKGEREWAVVEI